MATERKTVIDSDGIKRSLLLDGGGTCCELKKVTLMTSVDWGTVLSKVTDREITICTYGRPSPEYLKHISQMQNLTFICGVGNNQALGDYIEKGVKALNPNAKVHIKNDSHAKIVLIAPDEVYLSSQNLWPADFFQATVYIKDSVAYNEYMENVKAFIEKGLTGNISQSIDLSRYVQYEKISLGKDDFLIPAACPFSIQNVECKLSWMVNWNQKFNNVRDQKIIITTYSIPDEKYVCNMINKLLDCGNKVIFICNSAFEQDAYSLAERVNNLDFKPVTVPRIHAKLILRGENTVWLSSHNFGTSSWFENTIQIKSTEAYRFYYNELSKCLSMYSYVGVLS